MKVIHAGGPVRQMSRERRNSLECTVVFYGLQDLNGDWRFVRHSTRHHLHRNILTVHLLVDVGVYALRQDARVPEEVLGADEHELGEHDGVSAGRLRDVGFCNVVSVGRSRGGVETKMRESTFIKT